MYGWEFPPHISGGLGVACYDLTKALNQAGIDITFVLPKLKSQPAADLHLKLVSSHDIEAKSTISETIKEESYSELARIYQIDSPLSPYLNDQSYVKLIEKLLEQNYHLQDKDHFYKLGVSGDYGPNLISEVLRYAYVAGMIAKEVEHDLIHAHDWLTVMAGIEAKAVSNKPLIYHVHALETDRSGKNINPDIFGIEKRGLELADKIIAVSYLTKKNIVDNYHIDPEKIVVVHNAVSKTKVVKSKFKFKKKPNEKVVLFLGRLTFQKGPDYFLEAAAKVLKIDPTVRFIIAGTGDMINRLIERAAQLRISRNVHFTGFLDRPEVEELFASTDVYVMSSVSEPFGISSLEAVLFDVPVIISKQSGVVEVLSHSLKVNFWDTDELANKICGVIRYPALKKELYIQAAKELKNIQWENSAKQVVELYSSLL